MLILVTIVSIYGLGTQLKKVIGERSHRCDTISPLFAFSPFPNKCDRNNSMPNYYNVLKGSFPLRISLVNMTKSAFSIGFGHIYMFLCSIILKRKKDHIMILRT